MIPFIYTIYNATVVETTMHNNNNETSSAGKKQMEQRTPGGDSGKVWWSSMKDGDDKDEELSFALGISFVDTCNKNGVKSNDSAVVPINSRYT